jgi:hypothetical protein
MNGSSKTVKRIQRRRGDDSISKLFAHKHKETSTQKDVQQQLS